MDKSVIIVVALLCLIGNLVAQKPAIDLSLVGKGLLPNWEVPMYPEISADCNYASFSVVNRSNNTSTKYLIAISVKWKTTIDHFRDGTFTKNGRFFIYRSDFDSVFCLELGQSKAQFISLSNNYQTSNNGEIFFIKGKDSLCSFNPLVNKFRYLNAATSFQIFELRNRSWLLYRPNDGSNINNLVIQEYKSDKKILHSNVIEYWINEKNGVVVLKKKYSNSYTELIWENLYNITSKEIWCGSQVVGKHSFDRRGKQLAFF